MKGIKQHWLMIVFIITALFIDAQTQIGNDIEGLLSGDRFGRNVSLSSDGNIVAITSDIVTSTGGGRIRVFKNIEGVWTLHGTDTNGENFGGIGSSSLSISTDGNTLATGGWDEVVKIFNYNTETGIWSPKGSDITNTTSASQFGYSLKLSSDGSTIAIGSTSSPIVPEVGVTQIFQFETNSWNQVGNDINGLVPAEHSGRSVDMSSDGNTLSISNDNSVRVYQNVSDTWMLLGDEILATGSQSANRRISLSSNGNILAIGEPDFTDNLIQRGQVRVFIYESGSWNQVGSNITGEVAYYRTGWSVSLSSNGQVLAIGERGSTSGSTDKGRVRIFENQNDSWIQVGNEIFGEANEDYSSSVCLSSDATTLAIGASLNDGNGVDSGHVRVYSLSSLLSVNDFVQSKMSLFPNPAREQITVQLPEGVELKNINLYNSLGDLINSFNASSINISKLSNGIYFAEISTNKGKITKKIIVQ